MTWDQQQIHMRNVSKKLDRFTNRAFYGFGKAKLAYGGLILGSSQFTLLPKLPLKTMLDFKMVKIDSKNNHVIMLLN